MTYPFPELTRQLQFPSNLAVYLKIVTNKRYNQDANYWKTLPVYCYAHCPFCQQPYKEKANTFELRGWGYHGLAKSLYSEGITREEETRKHCAHFLGIRQFFNLHGLNPEEIQYFENASGEVPFVDRHFFAKQAKTYVVLHALPICRIETRANVPRYTVFNMIYFTEFPDQLIQSIYKIQEVRFVFRAFSKI